MDLQPLDPTFGQQRAFNLDDPLVNPNAISYLRGVRSQALTTSAISVGYGQGFPPRHTAALYDEPEYCTKDPGTWLPTEDCIATWLGWFTAARDKVLQKATCNHQKYGEKTWFRLILHHLKTYLEGQKPLRDIGRRVLDLLQDMGSESWDADGDSDDDELEIDPGWAESMLNKLEARNVVSLEDMKECIKSEDPNPNPPRGFKEWYHFLQSCEPTHFHFTEGVVSESLWTLVQYMSHDWVKDIYKQKNRNRTRRFSVWLLYILFHLPINLTAEYVSNLRELARRCQKGISTDVGKRNEMKRGPSSIKNCQSSEMVALDIPSPPEDLDILELTLTIVAMKYGQKDLIMGYRH